MDYDATNELDAMFPMHAGDNEKTTAIKGNIRSVAGFLCALRADPATSPAAKRSLSLALTELETASMYAVKSANQG